MTRLLERMGRTGFWRAVLLGSTTPGRLRRWTALLVLGCLAVAVTSVLTGLTRTDAAGEGGRRLATLEFNAGGLYEALSGANASAATGFGADRGAPSPTMLARYNDYVTSAFLRLQDAEGLLEPDGPDAALAETIGYQLPRYASQVDTAQVLRTRGVPTARTQLDSAANLMNSTIMPAANSLQRNQRDALAADYGRVGGFPVVVTLLAVATLVVVVGLSVREARRTKRRFNVGVLGAGVLMALALVWWVSVAVIADGRLDAARDHNTAVSALSQARVELLQMRADETATVADSDIGGIAPPTAQELQRRLAARFSSVLGPGGGLDVAEEVLGPSPTTQAIRVTATSWQDALRAQGAGSDASRVMFVRLTSALGDGISTDQGLRTAEIGGADAVLTGVAVGPAVLALLAAGAAVAGIRPRLREYR